MNENDFGYAVIRMLCVAIPCAACAIAFLFAILQLLRAVKLAFSIGHPKYPAAFFGSLTVLGLGVASLAICALVSEIGAVNRFIDIIGSDTKYTVAKACVFAYLTGLGIIIWRSCVFNIKKLLGIPLSPPQESGATKNGLFAHIAGWIPTSRRKTEIKHLQEERTDLLAKIEALTAENRACRTAMDSLHMENSYLATSNENLQNTMEQLKVAHAEQKLPAWATQLDVADLFTGIDNPTDKTRRFRDLSKLYHPDARNNPSGLKALCDHLQKSDPQWFRAACYEAYLLIKAQAR